MWVSSHPLIFLTWNFLEIRSGALQRCQVGHKIFHVYLGFSIVLYCIPFFSRRTGSFPGSQAAWILIPRMVGRVIVESSLGWMGSFEILAKTQTVRDKGSRVDTAACWIEPPAQTHSQCSKFLGFRVKFNVLLYFNASVNFVFTRWDFVFLFEDGVARMKFCVHSFATILFL